MNKQTPEEAIPEVLSRMRERFLGQKISGTLSPTGNWMAMTLLRADSGDIVLSMPVRPEMTNPYGGIHGGMMATLCDEAIGWAILSLGLEEHYVTINLNTDFLYAAMEGEVLEAHGKIVRHGKKMINAEVHVYNEKRQLLAHATSNLVVTSRKLKAEAVVQKKIRV